MSELDREGGLPELPAALRADCSRCVGLCCVADAFYAVQGFGYDKPARVPCGHLTSTNRCAIHAQRQAQGFTACRSFDCYGAGQRVTRDLGLAADWRADAEVARRAFAAYAAGLTLHRLMALLAVAETTVAEPVAAPLRRKRAELQAMGLTAPAEQSALEAPALRNEVMALIRAASPKPS